MDTILNGRSGDTPSSLIVSKVNDMVNSQNDIGTAILEKLDIIINKMDNISIGGGEAGPNYGTNNPGLYNDSGDLLMSWKDLIDNNYITVTGNDTMLSQGTNELRKSMAGKLVISDKIKSIADVDDSTNGALADCASLTGIEIPASVTSIGKYAFYGFSSSKMTYMNYTGTVDQWAQITFGDEYSNPLYYAKRFRINDEEITSVKLTTATKISDYAFAYANYITSIELPSALKTIGKNAFYYTGTQSSSVTFNKFPSTLETIGVNAFYGCSKLISADLSNTKLTTIDMYSFYNCRSLTAVKFPNTLVSIGRYAFYGCKSLITVDLSNTVITTINSYAFNVGSYNENGALSSINFPTTLETIGENAFYGSVAASIDLSSTNVTIIGNYAFGAGISTPLSVVNFPTTLETLGSHAFHNSDIISADLSATKLTEYSAAFTETKLSAIEFPNTLNTILDNAFYNCTALTSIDLSNTNITSLGYHAFSGCIKLTTINIPNTLTSINGGAFYNCTALTSIDLSNTNITSLGYQTFSYSGIVTIKLPESMSSFGGQLFAYCSKLTYFIIPNGIESIDNTAFFNCKALQSVYIPTSVTTISASYSSFPFYGAPSTCTLYCGASSAPTGWNSSYWNRYDDTSSHKLNVIYNQTLAQYKSAVGL